MHDLLRKGYIGHPAQLCTLRRVTVAEGKARGTELIEVKTAGGLELDILLDAGLDIGQCRFNGVNMSWMSKNGYDSPAVIRQITLADGTKTQVIVSYYDEFWMRPQSVIQRYHGRGLENQQVIPQNN